MHQEMGFQENHAARVTRARQFYAGRGCGRPKVGDRRELHPL